MLYEQFGVFEMQLPDLAEQQISRTFESITFELDTDFFQKLKKNKIEENVL